MHDEPEDAEHDQRDHNKLQRAHGVTEPAAENALQTLETKGSNKKNLVAAMAAAIILQSYLDAKK